MRITTQTYRAYKVAWWTVEVWLDSVHCNIINKDTFLSPVSFCWTFTKTHIYKTHIAYHLYKWLITQSFIRSVSEKHTHTRMHTHMHTCTHTHSSKSSNAAEIFFPLPSYTRLFLWQLAPVSGTEKWKLTGSMSSLQGAGRGMVGGLVCWLGEAEGVLKSWGSREWLQDGNRFQQGRC